MPSLFKRTPLAAAIVIALHSPLYSSTAVAAPVVGPTAGSEFRVNTETVSSQHFPSVALDADGDFVITWESQSQDGDGIGVYAQRYSADGTTAGGEFLVNTYTTSLQTKPSVALDADGDFVIAWQSQSQDGNSWGVYAQRYSADGTATSGEFQVNTETSSAQQAPSVAMDADGDFVIAWQSESQDGDGLGIYAQRYSADGTAAGDEFRVNTYTTSQQKFPSVALDADGDFVIAWQSNGQDGDGYGVYAQRYSADGMTVGDEFRVNIVTLTAQQNPSVALDADGDFVIAWQSYRQDDHHFGVYAQRYSADGTAVGGEFRVNTEASGAQASPSVALDADGDFVIAWQSNAQDGDLYGVYAQRYSADGTAVGGEFQVNTYITSHQHFPSVALDADGDFVIAWHSNAQDGDSYGIYAQRYEDASETVDLNLVVQDDTDPVTAGNNFTYSLITTNNGSGIAMDVNLSEPLPAGLTYVSDDAASLGWVCGQNGTTLNCNKPFMTAGEVSTILVAVTADTAGTLSNTVTVTGAQIDANVNDNTDTETTEVVAGAGTTTPAATGGGGALGGFSLLMTGLLWLRRSWR
jgi:uncharacterized repeat protein (TIGR01451 family)